MHCRKIANWTRIREMCRTRFPEGDVDVVELQATLLAQRMGEEEVDAFENEGRVAKEALEQVVEAAQRRPPNGRAMRELRHATTTRRNAETTHREHAADAAAEEESVANAAEVAAAWALIDGDGTGVEKDDEEEAITIPMQITGRQTQAAYAAGCKKKVRRTTCTRRLQKKILYNIARFGQVLVGKESVDSQRSTTLPACNAHPPPAKPENFYINLPEPPETSHPSITSSINISTKPTSSRSPSLFPIYTHHGAKARAGGSRPPPGAGVDHHHHVRGAELRVRGDRVLQPVRVLRHHQRVLRHGLPIGPLRRAAHQQRLRPRHRHPGLLRRARRPGRRRLRGQGLLHPRLLPHRARRLPVLRPHRLRRRLQARDRRLLRPLQPRDHQVLLHQRDRRAEQGLLRPDERPVAVRRREGLLRARPAAGVVELQLRAGGAEPRLRRGQRPGRGGAQPRRGLPGRAMVLDKQRARHHRLRPRVRGHHQGHQRRARVRRQEPDLRQQPRGILQAVLPAVRGRPRDRPHLLGTTVDYLAASLLRTPPPVCRDRRSIVLCVCVAYVRVHLIPTDILIK